MIISGNYSEYLYCSTKFDNEYNLVAITHHLTYNDSDLIITLS